MNVQQRSLVVAIAIVTCPRGKRKENRFVVVINSCLLLFLSKISNSGIRRRVVWRLVVLTLPGS